jgi:hypothetical protein
MEIGKIACAQATAVKPAFWHHLFRTTFDFSRKYRTAPLQDVTQTPEI